MLYMNKSPAIKHLAKKEEKKKKFPHQFLLSICFSGYDCCMTEFSVCEYYMLMSRFFCFLQTLYQESSEGTIPEGKEQVV